jgi:hypothetical protein
MPSQKNKTLIFFIFLNLRLACMRQISFYVAIFANLSSLYKGIINRFRDFNTVFI